MKENSSISPAIAQMKAQKEKGCQRAVLFCSQNKI